MPVGSFPDIVATKLKVVGDRGELRDYYDLMCIEEQGEADVYQMLQVVLPPVSTPKDRSERLSHHPRLGLPPRRGE